MFFVFRICVIVLITFLSYPSNYLQDLNFSYSQSAKGGVQHSHSAKGVAQHGHSTEGGAQQAEASGEPEIKKENITCPSCGHVNIPTARFCENCGSKL